VSTSVVHDYLNQRGGAERVALELARIWPGAPIHTSLYRPESTFPEFREHDVRTSWLDRVPTDRGFRNLLPFYPSAFRSLGTFDDDLVVSSSSGWAHGIRTAPGTAHVVYCHTPARWLYSPEAYLGASSRKQKAAQPVMGSLRRWDIVAAKRATVYVANSENTRRRIQRVYRRDAELVHPPVDIARFTPRERGERLLVVCRLLDYKRVDAVIRVANEQGIGLDVVGSGPSHDDLRALAGPTVEFHRRLDDAAVTELMESCRALVVPGEEDFGIVPVEAQAAGKPVVALGRGGALETVTEGVTGSFFSDHRTQSIAEALRRADAIAAAPAEIARHAARFSREAFAERMLAVADRALELAQSRHELAPA
jgi:glycosyltransferase involved in cell wall biosynthesis